MFLEISQKFTGKHLFQGRFFNKVAGLRSATLLQKTLWHRCFPGNFAQFLRTTFTMEHLWWLLLRRIFWNIVRWGNLKVRICFNYLHKQPFRGVLKKSCSENMQQIYRRTPTPKCDLQSNFIEITLRHGCSPVNLLHIFRTPFLKNTSEWVPLYFFAYLY